MRSRKLPLVAVGIAAALLVAERRWPIQPSPYGLQRRVTNAFFGLAALAVTGGIEVPLARRLARFVERRRWGLSRLEPGVIRNLLSVLWLDYALYLWHRAAHKWLPLWRFHLPHHLDPELDTTSAWRFHLLELLTAAPPRLLQILVAGVPRDGLQRWRELLFISICFHHSNLRLPRKLEQLLGFVIMTPTLHRIHHSSVRAQRDSNFSSGLSIWDHLHGSYRKDVDAATIVIGVHGEVPATGFVSTLLSPARPIADE